MLLNKTTPAGDFFSALLFEKLFESIKWLLIFKFGRVEIQTEIDSYDLILEKLIEIHRYILTYVERIDHLYNFHKFFNNFRLNECEK